MLDERRLDPHFAYSGLATPLEELRAKGLFKSLDRNRALTLLGSMLQPHFAHHLLASLVETHLRKAPGDDVVLLAGDDGSARQLERALRRPLAGVLWDDASEHGHVHLVGHGRMRPGTPRAWRAVFEAALAHLGDTRRFVTLFVAVQHDEPIHLLVDERQARSLGFHRLLRSRTQQRQKLPPAIAGRETTPPSVQALVDALVQKGIPARAHGARVAVELTLPDGRSLVDRVRADLGATGDERGERAERAERGERR